MSKCNSGSINSYCYICGQYIIPAKRQNITAAIGHNYAFYFSKVVMIRPWAPNICCSSCFCYLKNWIGGKIRELPFGVPMEWSDPGPNHHQYNCYVCANDARGRNRYRLRSFCYQSVPSAILPRPHSENVPVPKRPSPQTQNIVTCADVDMPDVDIPDAPPIPFQSEICVSSFLAHPEQRIQPLSEQQLHSIARNLQLSKNKSEILGNQLKLHNLILPSVNVTSFRTRNVVFKKFFSVNERKDLVYCNDVTRLMATMNICDYNVEEWRLFIDSSESSLKGLFVLLIKILQN